MSDAASSDRGAAGAGSGAAGEGAAAEGGPIGAAEGGPKGAGADGGAITRQRGESRPARRRVRHRVRLAAMAVALVAICLIALLATRPAAENTLADSPLVGKQAPSLAGSTLTGGRFSLGEDRGKYVVVNFFASWCPACQVEEPQLVQFAAEQRRGTHVAVLGVLFSDSASNAVSFFRSNGATWPAITDPQGQIAITYGVTNPPESFLVAPDGMVLAKIVGGVTASGLDHLIAEAGSIGRER